MLLWVYFLCSGDQRQCGLCVINDVKGFEPNVFSFQDFVCDAEFDCKYKNDEDNCTICPYNKWKCTRQNRNQCVPQEYFCDCFKDREKGGDEIDPCPEKYLCETESHGAFMCVKSEFPISTESVCDDEQNCDDNSDELFCMCEGRDEFFSLLTWPGSNSCGHKCIPDSLICDGHFDCQNGTDELHCKVTKSGIFFLP